MSRPQDLPAILKGFGVGNYPAGSNSWSGQPYRLLPIAPLVPGQTVPFPVLNSLAGNGLDTAQGALNLSGQLPAMNWGAAVTVGTAPAFLVWSDFAQTWYATSSSGGSSNLYFSVDFGKTWSTTAMTAAITAYDLAVDGSGNIVVLGSAGSWQLGTPGATYAPSSLTWAAQAGFASLTSGSIIYDPNGFTYQWFVLGANASGNIVAYCSATRTSWVGPALPTAWSSTIFGKSAVIGASGTGTYVAAFIDSGTTFRTIVRTSTGSLFTNDTQWTVAAGVGSMTTNTPGIISRPVWSANDSLWYLSVTGSTGSQVWSSPDGITWTSVRVFTTYAASYLCCLGSLLVFVDALSMVTVSWNKGANWWRCGRISAGAVTTMRAGGGGILATAGGTSYASQRFGLPVQAA